MLELGTKRSQETPSDISYFKEQRTWSAYTPVAEIARYLCVSPLKIEALLRQSKAGLDALFAKVNELLYDEITPRLFDTLYEATNYEKHEQSLSMTRQAASSRSTRPAKDAAFPGVAGRQRQERAGRKELHLDTYCFDTVPEQDFFLNVIRQDDIKEVNFTGLLTHGQSDFHLNYIDPETHSVRNYYPDFFIHTKGGARRQRDCSPRVSTPQPRKKPPSGNRSRLNGTALKTSLWTGIGHVMPDFRKNIREQPCIA